MRACRPQDQSYAVSFRLGIRLMSGRRHWLHANLERDSSVHGNGANKQIYGSGRSKLDFGEFLFRSLAFLRVNPRRYHCCHASVL